MNRFALVLLSALALSLSAESLSAQQPATVGNAYFARGVLEGIQLTREQKTALTEAIAAFSSSVAKTFGQPDLRRPLSAADSKTFMALRSELTSNIRKILTPSQQSRFDSNINALAARRNPG